MSNHQPSVKRFFIAAGIAGAVLGSASLRVPAAGADPVMPVAVPVVAAAPFLSAITVQASGLGAVIQFTSSEPASAAVAVKPVAATAAPANNVPIAGHLPAGAGAGIVAPTTGTSIEGTFAPATFETSHQMKLTNLKSNTAYDVTVSAQTHSGANLSGHVQFQTAKQRIRVTVDSIDVTQSGAIFGGADANWQLGLRWGPGPGYNSPLASGTTSTCFPHFSTGCVTNNYGEYMFHPQNNYGKPLGWVFAEENFDFMPQSFTVGAAVSADPGWFSGGLTDIGNALGASFTPGCYSDNSWQVPQGVESGSKLARTCADDYNNGFESNIAFRFELFYDNAAYPVPQRNMATDPWAK